MIPPTTEKDTHKKVPALGEWRQVPDSYPQKCIRPIEARLYTLCEPSF